MKSIDAELAKLGVVEAIPIPASLFEGFSDRVLDRWGDRFGSLPPSSLLAIDPAARRVLAAAWLRRRQAQLIDGIVDLLISVAHKIISRAERRVECEQLADLRRVKGTTNLLFRLAEAALANPEGTISDVLFPIVDPEDLADLVREYHTDGPALRSMANDYARSSYARHYRRSLLAVLERLLFDSSNTAHRPVCDAIELIRRYGGRSSVYFDLDEEVPVKGIVTPAWRACGVGQRRRVERVNPGGETPTRTYPLTSTPSDRSTTRRSTSPLTRRSSSPVFVNDWARVLTGLTSSSLMAVTTWFQCLSGEMGGSSCSR